jgi:RNA polymerase sigma factor (sigma-70 family)
MSPFQKRPELLVAFREGQVAALEEVYRAYVPAIDRQVRSLARRAGVTELSQPSAVADLLQDIFIRAFSPAARRAYDGVRDYGPYLATIAHNCFVDALRGRREVANPIEDQEVDPRQTGLENYCDAEVLVVVKSYLSALPEGLEGVYRERFVLGRSQSDASAALGLSRRELRTAEDHLRRGLRKALARAGLLMRESGAAPSPTHRPKACADP